jgi:hypothetical protein
MNGGRIYQAFRLDLSDLLKHSEQKLESYDRNYMWVVSVVS